MDRNRPIFAQIYTFYPTFGQKSEEYFGNVGRKKSRVTQLSNVLTMITPKGLSASTMPAYIHSQLTAKHLFAELN